MIHQIIFANPKPGMGVREFQDYWIDVHAQKYARNITQILHYKVNRILKIGDTEPAYHGMAEIWLKDEQEQLLSLQSDAFVKGARADEPNWAAFWRSICLDTHAKELLPPDGKTPVKLVVVCKRRGGIPLNVFRVYAEKSACQKISDTLELKGLLLNTVKDNAYGFGEPLADVIFQMWFEDLPLLKKNLNSPEFEAIKALLREVCETDYIHLFACEENIILP
jgi:hypothetical protein